MQGGDLHADDDTRVERELRRERGEERADCATTRTDVVPVEGECEKTETFVTGGAAEDTGNPCAVLSSETEDGDTGEGGCDVLWKPFPNEDTDEDTPEEDAALLLEEDAFAAVHRVEELDLWHDERVDSPSGVHEVAPSEASKAISKQLGRDEPVAQASGQPLQIRRGRENGRRT